MPPRGAKRFRQARAGGALSVGTGSALVTVRSAQPAAGECALCTEDRGSWSRAEPRFVDLHFYSTECPVRFARSLCRLRAALEMADLDRNMRAVTEGRGAPFPGP
ncbi:hypothetical protein GCM10023193_36290 [Planotetraspora kaengkrachanensis]|uniref:Uncharacterized protein n=1 Tax=Planotetraspora kaengkrachanensis TaxID=575193 RepID=A0A8J3LV51_9ACTN|nr:hypothetical protein Pka01_20190 [Planotetraspora kaengkrachanensis]